VAETKVGNTPEGVGDACDVIVIGGGINGVAVARDVAMRGLSVLLLEKDDLSHAASAWNSRMIHGGIKYLETHEIRLVRESLREREWLLRAAPHLVKPYPFLMPFLRRNRRPPWLLRLGMLGYDVLSLDKSLPRHRILDARATRELAPGLRPDEVRGGALFYDAQAEYAERLGVETAVSAHAHGATIVCRREVTKIITAAGRVTGVEHEDRITGQTAVSRARVVVNATGAWVDRLLDGLPGHDRPLAGPSKGTHLVVDPFPGSPKVALYYEAMRDGRAVLVLPWRDRCLIGSTDIRVDGDIDGVRADDEEFEYILAETNALIPEANLTRESIRFVYTGVRPLPYAAGGDVGTVTRDHIVHDHAPAVDGLYSIVGGKLTTFRALGEQAGDIVARKLGVGRRSSTRAEVLPGGRTADMAGFAERLMERSGVDPASAQRLVGIYGVRAEAILDRAKAEPRLATVIDERHGVTAAEVVHAIETEFARTLTDVLMRRTMVGLDPDVDIGAVESIAEAMGDHEGWSRERLAREIDDFMAVAERARPNAASISGPLLASA
jgi:glycerol-3-phosphate dehydrogenase